MLTIFSIAVWATLASPAAAAAEDIGNIAVIEDSTGLILPAEGMCDNILFASGLCLNHAATAFYATHADNYDILVFFTTKQLNFLFNVQMGFPVQVAAEGIGLESTSLLNPAQFGSAGRLRQCVKMGSMPNLPNNPNDLGTVPAITGIELLAHEIGHQWLCWILVDHDDGRGPIPILRGWEDGPNGHWSCWFNNHGSVMYGGNLTDNGDGTFTDTGCSRRYSQLDQYLMGLRTADEVDDMWYVDVDGTTEGCPSMPMGPGVEWVHEGTRVDFPIEDIIRANGPRVPELENCHLKAGFAIVYESGAAPTEFDIAKADIYRTELENWWPGGTDMRGSLDTRLDGCGTGTAECPGEHSPQCGEPECKGVERRCSHNVVQQCIEDEWAFAEECLPGTVCVDGECIPVDCDGDIVEDGSEGSEAPESSSEDWEADYADCVPGERFCCYNDLRVCLCSAEGKPEIVDVCGASGKVCVDAACVEAGEDASGSGGSGGCKNVLDPKSAWLLVFLFAMLVVLRRKQPAS